MFTSEFEKVAAELGAYRSYKAGKYLKNRKLKKAAKGAVKGFNFKGVV